MKLVKSYQISMLHTEAEAKRVVDFFFSDQSFDDSRYTPGEIEHFRNFPYESLQGEHFFWFAQDEQGEVIAANCFSENEQKTGGYVWEYLVIHKEYREAGIASKLIEMMFAYLRDLKARFLIGATCDLPEYTTIKRMFETHQFQLIGRYPDYYYEGEDRLVYYKRIE